ncbi:MAG: hypothetical protein Q7T70_09785 [Polaromonas sp.]|nr:hypothetical protein [Polaromonas sp.]
MHAQHAYRYILIGLNLRILRNIAAHNDADFVLTSHDSLKRDLEASGFIVSLAGMSGSFYKSMISQIQALSRTDKLNPALAAAVVEQAGNLETVVYAEAMTKNIYVLPQRRFHADYLLSDPKRLLKDGSFQKLSEIAQSDLASAGRCILFGEGTAAAFHILRATESVLKSYYFLHRKQNRLKNPMWAAMLEQLKGKTKNRPGATLLASLDLIRSAYRNPTQHPELTYEIDAAQDLFGVCLDVIGKMAIELEQQDVNPL